MKRSLRAALAAVALIGCAGERAPSPAVPDPIIIPETAVSVRQMALFRNNSWIPLNQRMLLARAGTKDYLVIFNDPCTALRDPAAVVVVQTFDSNALFANSDSISVGRIRCPIGDIYSILREDAISLQSRAGR